MNQTPMLTRELYEGLQRADFDRWDPIVAGIDRADVTRSPGTGPVEGQEPAS